MDELGISSTASNNNNNMNKKETILERLSKRNKDRQNYLETKLELRNKEHTESEGADYFAQIFSERVKSIENDLNNIQPDCDLKKFFATISNDIQELQKYLSNSTLFLPDYNIKACQNILNELTSHNEEMKQKLIPKKKFGFHNKKVGIKTIHQKNVNDSHHECDDDDDDDGFDKVDFSEKSTTISSSSFEWTLSNKENEYVLLCDSDTVERKDLTISNVKNCFIDIQGYPGSLQISNAKNCTILSGPISRSLFAENCNDCQLIAACQQLRLHSSTNIKLFIHVTCRAIIEDCTQIEVSNYDYNLYSGVDVDFKKSGLDTEINNYKDIADFNWLSPDKPSPNWKLIDDEGASVDTGCKLIDWNKIRENFKRINFKK